MESIVNVAKSHSDNIVVENTLQPSHYMEIARLPEEKQAKIMMEVANN